MSYAQSLGNKIQARNKLSEANYGYRTKADMFYDDTGAPGKGGSLGRRRETQDDGETPSSRLYGFLQLRPLN